MQQLRRPIDAPKGQEPIKVNKTIKAVKKGQAKNVEVEGFEQILAPMMFDGFPANFTAKGPSHAAGGIDLNLPANSFIFSDDYTMKIKNPDIQKDFGKREKETGYTPAEIAKQYDINQYRKVLADPNTDKMQRDTAEMMIKNYNEKLGKLAVAQESKKGFPSGVPFVAIPYLESMGMDPSQFVNSGSDQSEAPTQSEEDIPQQRKGGQIKIRITKLPEKMQEGGPVENKNQEFVYNPEFYEDFSRRMGLGQVTANVPATLNDQKGAVDNVQPAIGNNTYGRKNWTDPNLFNDWKNRHQGYLKDHPDFDPTNKKDVLDFQKTYNKNNPGYFKTNPGSKYSIDGKFGEVTYSAPSLDQKAAAPVQQPQVQTPINQTQPDLQKPIINYGQQDQDTPFWTQDLINLAGAFGDQQRLKKYLPWQAGYDTVVPRATYYDPERELAANAEQTNIADQALGAFAGPQALSARLSSTQGQGLANAANILGKYNDLNVGIANQTEAYRTNITNDSNLNRAQQATNLYDKTVLANQNYQNAQAQARQNTRQAFIQAYTNRGQTQALNSINDQFRVDPVSGFRERTGVQREFDKNFQTQSALDLFNQIRKQPGMTDQTATDILKTIMGQK